MYDLVKKEQEILNFWKKNNIFKKSIRDEKSPEFVFYEGPPTANGQPGIHHIEARAFKDIICRYKNMKGFRVLRKAGWDTHGLPVEIQVEKELGLNDKKGIEEYGIAEFNKKCQESVWRYQQDWEKMTERIGFWIDMENPYITYDNKYIESVWWILKQIWDKNLLFRDYKIVPFCPRCGTTLSSHELAQGYKKVKEASVYVKFEIKDQSKNYFLVWTTTPWTLPGNVAIAINPRFTYLKVKIADEFYILAKERISVLENENYEIVEEISGASLVGLEYCPLYEIKEAKQENEKAYEILPADFVTLEDGTGLVHIAPAFGEEDYQLIKEQKEKFSFLMTVDKQGKMLTPGYEWHNLFVKKADQLIIKDLEKRNILFKQELYEHDYPFCWRCDTPLIYYAQSSWFIKMTVLREKLLENNEKINWVPANLKAGRFGEWLREVKDWNLSRERYWGTPLPIWLCENEKCENQKAIGSIEELENLSGKKIQDLHRPYIDEIEIKCEKCGGKMKRTPEVIDCWFDSGSMPLAQQHYPFENKELVDNKKVFPADYICEGIDQTRGWFYTLLAISTLLDLGVSYKNVVVTGIVLDEKGQKMSKSKGNIVIPQQVIEKFGADCIRLYFYTLNQVDQPKRFSLKEMEDLYRKFFSTLENCLSFLKMYENVNSFEKIDLIKLNNILDQWVISKTNNLIVKLSKNLEEYDIVSAARLFLKFIDDLSNWYIRRSRKRFQKPEIEQEKNEAIQTLKYVLKELAKLLAPFTPFLSEHFYQNLKDNEDLLSVHFCDYPQINLDLIKEELENDMEAVRDVAAMALGERVKAGIKVRQPLSLLKVSKHKIRDKKELLDLIKEEVNVKEVKVDAELKEDVFLDLTMTEELKKEGRARELIRKIQQFKKELEVMPQHQVFIIFQGEETAENFIMENKELIEKETAIKIASKDEKDDLFKNQKEVKIEEMELTLFLKII